MTSTPTRATYHAPSKLSRKSSFRFSCMARSPANWISTATPPLPSAQKIGNSWNTAPGWWARSWKTLRYNEAPRARPRQGPGMKHVVAALIVKDGKLLVCQRTRHQTMPLKWEFPGGKIEEGEQPRDALRRELQEELGIEAVIGEEIARI